MTTDATDTTPAEITLDGSDSFDPDGELTNQSFTWELLRFKGAASVAQSLPIGA